MWNPFSRKQTTSQENDIDEGEYSYYIIEEGTSKRMLRNGEPIIFTSKEAAEFSCEDVYDIPIKVASYNREFDRFIGKKGKML